VILPSACPACLRGFARGTESTRRRLSYGGASRGYFIFARSGDPPSPRLWRDKYRSAKIAHPFGPILDAPVVALMGPFMRKCFRLLERVFLCQWQTGYFNLPVSPPPRRDASTGKLKKIFLCDLCGSVVR
jgi:hypothetical protein